MKSALSDFILGKKGVYGILYIIILLMSLFLIISILTDTFKGIPFYTQPSYMEIQLQIYIQFLSDFVLEFFLVKHKWRYMRTHFILLLVTTLYQNIITCYGQALSPEVTYLLRFIPLLRGGYVLVIAVGWLAYNRASSLLVPHLTMLLATVHFTSLTFFVLEHKVNPLVTSYEDVLWWAFMDVITVGPDIIAMATTERVLSVLLVALEMVMLPTLTVYITNLVQQSSQKKKQYCAEEEERKESAQGT